MNKHKLTPNDAPRLFQLECAAQPVPWSEENLRLELNRDASKSYSWVGTTEEGTWHTYVLARQVMDELWILQVGTAPEYRRRGSAMELLKWVLQDASKVSEIASVLLEVRESNRGAITLYERLGFVREGVRPKYYPPVAPGGVREAAVLMRLSLVR